MIHFEPSAPRSIENGGTWPARRSSQARYRTRPSPARGHPTHERITVTRHGRPVAVLLSAEDFASMVETLDVLSTPGALEDIRASLAEFEAGDSRPWESLRAEFGRPASVDVSPADGR